MDLIDDIDQLLTEKAELSCEVKRLMSLGANSATFREALLSRRAIVALRERDIPQALSAAFYAVQRNPTQPEYAMLLGKVYLTCHEIDFALEAFETAVALQPDNFDYQFIYLQTLYLRRPALAQTITREIAKYVTRRSLGQYVAFAKHLNVPIEGGAWSEDGVVTIWMPKAGRRSYAKFRVSWMSRDGWSSELVELSDDSDGAVCTLSFPWLPDAEVCTIKKARNGELLHGCPLFGKLQDKSLRLVAPLAQPESGSVQVIIPVYKGLKETRECLESVLQAETQVPFKVTVVLDNPNDAKLARFIDGLEANPRATIIKNTENVGFTASVNRALDANEGEDVVLLNADTVVPDGWLDRLRRAAFSAPDIGTVTPISNNGEIVSFPIAREQNQIPAGLTLEEIDDAAAEVNHGTYVDLPTGVGFCLFIKAETLHSVGRLDSFNFGRGYGEETDFCLRARAVGWRSICATDLFVKHVSKVSFGVEKDALARLNMKRVQKKHPEYSALMQGFLVEEPLLEAFKRLERKILPKRSDKSWTLVVAPTDWRTNLGLEGFRHDAACTGKPILWLYPDSKLLDRMWLTSDTTFEFGRLFYELEGDMSELLEDVSNLDITEVHWFEPPKSAPLVEIVAAMDVPQTCHLCSAKMPKFLLSGEPAAGQLTKSCTSARTVSEFGARVAKELGFASIDAEAPSSLALFPDAQNSPMPSQKATDQISIAVIDGFQSREGVSKLLDMARYAAAQDLNITFYLFANTLHDLSLSRTSKSFPLGFVDPEQHEAMLRYLNCDGVLSVDLEEDPAPLVLKRGATQVEHVFCFKGAGRSELASSNQNITFLEPTMSGPEAAQRLLEKFESPVEMVACAG